jgi:hypothetical protein
MADEFADGLYHVDCTTATGRTSTSSRTAR